MSITGISGLDMYIMHSSYQSDKVIDAFREAIENGHHPNDIESQVWKSTGVDPTQLPMWEKQKIQRKVEEIYQTYTGY